MYLASHGTSQINNKIDNGVFIFDLNARLTGNQIEAFGFLCSLLSGF
jgi:hypothetical protein